MLTRTSIDEAIDVTRIYSVADQLPPDVPLISNLLFRSRTMAVFAIAHPTISHFKLMGVGNLPHPRETPLVT